MQLWCSGQHARRCSSIKRTSTDLKNQIKSNISLGSLFNTFIFKQTNLNKSLTPYRQHLIVFRQAEVAGLKTLIVKGTFYLSKTIFKATSSFIFCFVQQSQT